jgi:hypothetical protein
MDERTRSAKAANPWADDSSGSIAQFHRPTTESTSVLRDDQTAGAADEGGRRAGRRRKRSPPAARADGGRASRPTADFRNRLKSRRSATTIVIKQPCNRVKIECAVGLVERQHAWSETIRRAPSRVVPARKIRAIRREQGKGQWCQTLRSRRRSSRCSAGLYSGQVVVADDIAREAESVVATLIEQTTAL